MPKKPTPKTTEIVAFGETWKVPRGFGAAYTGVAAVHASYMEAGIPGCIYDSISQLLARVGYEVAPATIEGWPLRQRVEAEVYAHNLTARICGAPIRGHRRPRWLPDPWRGPVVGEGALRGPSPTRVAA